MAALLGLGGWFERRVGGVAFGRLHSGFAIAHHAHRYGRGEAGKGRETV